MRYCLYYQAIVNKSLTWFFVSTFRSFEFLAFDRTFDVQKCIFEFFVPVELENEFLKVMKFYQEKKIVSELKKLKNRIQII